MTLLQKWLDEGNLIQNLTKNVSEICPIDFLWARHNQNIVTLNERRLAHLGFVGQKRSTPIYKYQKHNENIEWAW